MHLSRQPFQLRLDLQSQHPRKVPTDRQVAAVVPEPRVARVPPQRTELARLVVAPNVPQPVRDRDAKDGTRLRPHVLVAGSENDLVGRELRPVGELEPVGAHLGDLLAVLHLDLAVDDELRGANVDVVAFEFFLNFFFLATISKDHQGLEVGISNK